MNPQSGISWANAQPSTDPSPGVQLHTQQSKSEQPLPDLTPAPDKPQHAPILCRVVSEVVNMSSKLTHPLICACHGNQVQQPPADATQQTQATCPVSGHPLTSAQLKRNDSMVQVCMSPAYRRYCPLQPLILEGELELLINVLVVMITTALLSLNLCCFF